LARDGVETHRADGKCNLVGFRDDTSSEIKDDTLDVRRQFHARHDDERVGGV